MTVYRIFCEDCIRGMQRINEGVIDLAIGDSPFGIKETRFYKRYRRKNSKILPGYVEAPEDYLRFTRDWMGQVFRVLRPGGAFWAVMGWNRLPDLQVVAKKVGFEAVNHIIWKYQLPLPTKLQFSCSHYHLLYYVKPGGNRTFVTNCRFDADDRQDGKSLLYPDMQSVWEIPKVHGTNEYRNLCKLPVKLVEKIVRYTSRPGDTILDPFLGNFTTAYAALPLGRGVIGFELNPHAVNYHLPRIAELVSAKFHAA